MLPESQNNPIMLANLPSTSASTLLHRTAIATVGLCAGLWVFGFSLHAQTSPPGPAMSELRMQITVQSNQTVRLDWTDIGSNYAYAVWNNGSLAGCDWAPCPNANTWPIRSLTWTDPRPIGAIGRAYRVVAVSLTTGDRGRFVSATLLNSIPKTTVAALLSQLGVTLKPTSGVAVYKILYETVDPFGGSVLASGALVMPDVITRALPLVSYQHGTIITKQDVPSRLSTEIAIGVAFGSTDYLAVLPDYLGLGDSPGFHPYHHARSEATAVVDMLRAARRFCASNSIALNQQLFLCGYSQGGHATMAAHRELETFHTNEFTITGSTPMAGAYDMSGVTTQDFLSNRLMPNPYYFLYLLAGCQSVYRVTDSFPNLFAAPFSLSLPPLVDGRHDSGFINRYLPDVPVRILLPEVLTAFINDTNNPLRAALRDNDLYDWTPRAPMRMYHCHGDQDVIYANSEVAYRHFIANGASQVQLIDPYPQGNHGTGLLPCLLGGKAWFDSLKQ